MRSPARTSALVSATALLVGATVFGLVTQGTGQAASTTSPIIFGAAATNQAQVLADEKVLGRHMEGVHYYRPWDGTLFGRDQLWMRDTSHTIFLSVEAKRKGGGSISFASIAAAAPGSQLYTEMQSIAAQIKAFGAPVYVTFNHEPEASGALKLGTGAQFAAAWRKFVTVMRASGVTNAKYLAIFTGYGFKATDARAVNNYYPGDTYVDAVGADLYNWAGCRNQPWTEMSSLVAAFKAWGALHPSKALVIGEYGSVEDHAVAGHKAQWIRNVETLFKSPGYSQFKAVLYWGGINIASKCAFNFTTSTSAQAAWAAMGKDPAYLA